MPIYSKYTGVGGGGPALNFVGVAPITVTDIAGTVTTSMTQSNSTTNGWLSAVDWGVFNSKQSALTFGNLTGDTNANISISGGTGAVIGSGTSISQTAASASSNGYLTSSNWNTFNNKADYPSQTGNSEKVLATNGSSVYWAIEGVKTGYPGGTMVVGRLKPTSLTGTENCIAGGGAADALSSGIRNTFLGIYAGGDVSTGQQNTIIGYAAGYTSGKALLATGNFNVLVGSGATTSATNTSNCVAVGWWANAANNSVAVGYEAGKNHTANNNVSVGYGALKGQAGANGQENVVVGNNSCPDVTSAAQNSTLGYQAGLQMSDGFANTLVGWNTGNTITSGIGNTLIGYNCQAASATTNNAFVLGSNSTAGAASIAMGSSVTGGPSCVTIGQSSTSSGSTGSIALGHSSSTAGTSNICSIGSTVQNITTTYLGLGAEQILAAGDFKAIKLMTSRAASGGGLTNIDASAGTLTLAGSQSSGTGVGGSVFLATAPAGTSGNTLNAHVNRLEVTATNSGDVKVLTGDLMIETGGKGLKIKDGANAKIGVTGAFPGGGTNTVTVSTTAVTANSIIFLAAKSGASTVDPKLWVSAQTAGTSFVISSGDNSFTGTVGWMIVDYT